MAVEIFQEIGMLLIIATLTAGLLNMLRQPMVIGYILTGIILGPYALGVVNYLDAIEALSQVGIIFLLFIVGLNLDPRELKEVGKAAVTTGVGQVLFTMILATMISMALGYNTTESLYIAIAVSFSSTIIIMKLLSDKKALETLYGRISIGFLIVQDLIAMLILVAISASTAGSSFTDIIITTLVKGTILTIFLYIVGYKLISFIGNKIAESQEFLFMFSIGWVLVISFLYEKAGFTLEIGALIGGILLSTTKYRDEIAARMKPLRDFFLVMFFIWLGAQMAIKDVSHLIIPALVYSVLVLIGNPLIVTWIMGRQGYTKRTGFFAGLAVAQISEFSLIIIALGNKVGQIGPDLLTLLTIVALITIGVSTYMILYAEKIYPYIAKYLTVFEKKEGIKEQIGYEKKKYKSILFGYDRIGYDIYDKLVELDKDPLIVDYNPKTIEKLVDDEVPCMFGDASDEEFLDGLKMENTELVISTIPNPKANNVLIRKVKKVNPSAKVIVITYSINDAFRLYDAGADFVVLPHFTAADKIVGILTEIDKLEDKRKQHIKELKKKKKLGHFHPYSERWTIW